MIQNISAATLWVLLTWAGVYLWSPFLFVALVPFGYFVLGEGRMMARLLLVWAAAALYFGAIEYWFAFYNTGAWIILAMLQGVSLLPVAIAIREGQRRGIPLCLTLPVSWVAGEYLRSLGPFGFPIGALGPHLYRQLWMIQIADLGGVFLVSFAVAMINGAILDLWRLRLSLHPQPRQFRFRIVGSVAGVWLAIAGYGHYRLAESLGTREKGPVVAVIQPDVPVAADVGEGYDPARLFEILVAYSRAAAHHDPAPKLIVWPESGHLPPLNPEFFRADEAQIQRTVDFMLREQPTADRSYAQGWLEGKMRQGRDFAKRAQALADETNAGLVIGAPMRLPELNTTGAPWRSFNAAFFFRPHLPPLVQQKVHLFPVAERIPFVGTWAEAPFRWLAKISGAQPEFELQPGANLLSLEMGDAAGSHRFILPICGEIDLARTAGIFLPDDSSRIIVNISDDGAFQRSAMLQVRQSMLAYRAVESRSAIARSANTGVSCFVRPTGEIYGEVTNREGKSWTGLGFPEHSKIAEVLRHKAAGTEPAAVEPLVAEIEKLRADAGVEGYNVQQLDLDSRHTIYSRVGDLFAQLCTGGLLLALLSAGAQVVQKRRRMSDPLLDAIR